MPATPAEVAYRSLVRRVQRLKRNFVPPFHPLGNYTPDQQDDLRAFILLTHAALERYFEDVCGSLAQDSCVAWAADGVPRRPVLALLAFGGTEIGEPPHEVIPGPSSLRQTVDRARIAYGNRVYGNNGIRRKDVLGLLISVGVQEFELDLAWLASVDAFGIARGEHAHASPAAQTVPDAKDLVHRLAEILIGLRRIVRLLSALSPA